MQRRVRQYQALADDAVRLRLAKQLVRAKIEGQHRYLLRSTRGPENMHDRNAIRPDLISISGALADVAAVHDIDTLRGHEGDAAVHYFAGLRSTLSNDVPESLRYAGRSRRPTLDRFSAILNFGYALLQTAVMRAVLAVGPGRIDDKGNRVPLDIQVGDRVIYSKYGGTEVKHQGTEYLILSARDVLAVVA